MVLFSFFIGLFFQNKKQDFNKKYQVSVVVAARNEEQNITNILSGLVNQTYPSDLYEIIIVDDASSDRTGEIIDNFAKKYPNVKHVHSQPDLKTGLTAKKNALNQGIQKSSSEIILTTDADCHVKSTWIETMVSYFSDNVGMVVGFSQLGDKKNKYSLFEQLQAIDFLSLMTAAQGTLNLKCPLAASGQNLAYRKGPFSFLY